MAERLKWKRTLSDIVEREDMVLVRDKDGGTWAANVESIDRYKGTFTYVLSGDDTEHTDDLGIIVAIAYEDEP